MHDGEFDADVVNPDGRIEGSGPVMGDGIAANNGSPECACVRKPETLDFCGVRRVGGAVAGVHTARDVAFNAYRMHADQWGRSCQRFASE